MMPAADKPRLIAGAMSGTSADGIDVAITEITGTGLAMSAKLIRHHARPYDAALKQAIFALRGTGQVSLAELARIGREISLAYAACVNEAMSIANLKSSDLTAIAAHGQTLYHDPPNTIQWLDPALIAAETGCAVVSDFRRADCAAGGQGAPLVPFADYILFRHPTRSRVLLNIGGIANLTHIPAGASIDQLVAFDTGPGNCLSDWICRKFDPTGPGFDLDGQQALRGTPSRNLACIFNTNEFLIADPPKSTDTREMIDLFERVMLNCQRECAAMTFEDLLASACLTTAMTIEDAIAGFHQYPNEVIVSGGGTRNRAMMDQLKGEFSGRFDQNLRSHLQSKGQHILPIMTTEEVGVPAEAKEAIAFALLAAATLDGSPSNVPSCTGAKHHVLLGSITPNPHPSNPRP